MPTTVPTPVLDARDEDTVVAQAIGALPAELSDRSDANPAVVILEAAGFIYGQLAYQLNRWPSAVVQKCLSLVDATLQSATAATAAQTFTLSAPQPTDTTIVAGTQVSTTDGSVTFATLADLTIPAYDQALAGTITFTAGSATVGGSGTAFVTGSTWVGRQIAIQGSSTWHTIANVASTTSLTITTTAAYTASGAYWVGPVSGSTNAQATTTGAATNVGAAKLTSLQSAPATVASTTNAAAAAGGADAESVDEAIARAPAEFAARDIACTASDFAYFARRALGAGGRATARENYNATATAAGYVSVACLAPTWTAAAPAPAAARQGVVRDLTGRYFAGATLVDLAAGIYQPTPAVAVIRKASYDAVTVRVNVAAALNTYLSPNTYPWGRTIHVPDLVQVIEAADGVDRVYTLNGVPSVSTAYVADLPANVTFAASAGPHTTASTAGITAGQTYIADSANNQAYLVVSLVANVSITLDRTWTGGTGGSSPTTVPYWVVQPDTLGAAAGEQWRYLPYSTLSVLSASPPVSIYVVGSE